MQHIDFSPYVPSSRLSLIFTAGAASVFAFVAYQSYSKSAQRARAKAVFLSPRNPVVSKLSEAEKAKLPYPSNVLPGARDVDSPYGAMRVYEFGPENGRKVLLIHGISTPCLSLGGVAQKLADRGCRVMIFDLFGRGYSDNPVDTYHDVRLYTTQILIALSSSPLSGWTGHNAFSLVGYSLGGGISVAFTSYYASMVKSLVLIAPSGLVREYHIALSSRFLYQTEGILPERLINYLVWRRLNNNPTPISNSSKKARSAAAVQNAATATRPPPPGVVARPEDAVTAELPAADDAAPLFAAHPTVTVFGAVQWQLENHPGFIPAFVSAIRHGPVTGEHERWRLIGRRLAAQKAGGAGSEALVEGLEHGKVLVVLGRADPVIIQHEVSADAEECLGKDNMEVVSIAAGHDLPVTKSTEVVDALWTFWEGDGSRNGA